MRPHDFADLGAGQRREREQHVFTRPFSAMHAPPSSSVPHVVIIGAGPAGCLLALLLSNTARTIHVYDYRPDPRQSAPTSSTNRRRSINLAISTRGLTALSKAGLSDKVAAIGVPMHGRCVHPASQSASLQFQRYGLPGQFLLSVSRERLNNLLLDACDAANGIQLSFAMRCVSVDLDTPSATLQPEDGGEPVQVSADLVVGADGAFSRVRAAMARRDRFDFSQSYISAAYKELSMVNAKPHGTGQAFPPEWLHIWPRHRFMLIALPNGPSSFTCTLFMDKEQIDALDTPELVEAFFNDNFPDAVAVMPTLAQDFRRNPTPSLLTIRCEPYNYQGKAVIIGDAAHAIVPFYGQGCNAAFEDCRLLAETMDRHGWEELQAALSEYSRTRKANADAIADLAIDHYEDMSSRSAKSFFVLRRRLEILANRFFPRSFLPLYSMISFSNSPYAEAVERAMEQDKVIERCVTIVGATTLCTAAILAARGLGMKSKPG